MPEDWLAVRGEESPVRLPQLMRDDPADYLPAAHAPEMADRNRRTTERLLESVLPLIHRGAAL